MIPFDPNDPRCRPAILDMRTGRPLPDTHPTMIAATKIWEEMPREKQEALHRVWVGNSRAPEDLEVGGEFTQLLREKVSN